MLALIQRVTHASVTIDDKVCADIKQGILLLCGFEAHDNLDSALKIIEKCTKYRIFADRNDKMNLGLCDIGGEMLLVPQFTLAANTQKGLRPSFSSALPPDDAKALFARIQLALCKIDAKYAFGVFGADMQVALCNDGPATFLLRN